MGGNIPYHAEVINYWIFTQLLQLETPFPSAYNIWNEK